MRGSEGKLTWPPNGGWASAAWRCFKREFRLDRFLFRFFEVSGGADTLDTSVGGCPEPDDFERCLFFDWCG